MQRKEIETDTKKGDLQVMYTHFKKLLPIACAACACLTVSADSSRYNGHHDDDSKGHGSCDSSGREIKQMGLAGLHDASPHVKNGADVFLQLDFIYWACGGYDGAFAQTGGIERLKDASGGMVNAPRGTTQFFDTDFDPGFKATFGLNLDHDGDDTLLRYTWYHSNHTDSASKANDTYAGLPFSAMGVPADIVDGFPLVLANDKVTAEYWVQFNNFDWEFARGFYTSPYMTLRFHVGLKGGWGNNRQKTVSSGLVLNDWDQNEGRDFSCYDNLNTSFKQDVWWIGIRAGFDPSFYFSKNWSMFGKAALSTLWNGNTEKYKEKIDVCNNSQDASGVKTTKTVTNTKGTYHDLGTVLELEIGFRYEQWWDDDNYHVAVEASWENQDWSVGPAEWFQGFRFGVRFSF
jgi:hypothetical protein